MLLILWLFERPDIFGRHSGLKLRMGKKKNPESGPPLALWKMGAPVVPLKPMSAGTT